MRSLPFRIATVTTAGVAVVLALSSPASASQQPNQQASCLAKIFQAQAVDQPRTVSNRILEIREYDLQGDPFGQALKPLAHGTFAFCP